MISWHTEHALPRLNINHKSIYPFVLASLISRISIILVAIFSSIYVFEATQDIGFSTLGSIYAVIIFFIIHFVFKAAFLLWAEDLSRKYGFKRVIMFSVAPFMVFLALICFGRGSIEMMYLAGAAWGVQSGFYWWGYHGIFSKLAREGKVASSIGKADVLYTLGALATPLAGAVIIDFLGFGALILVSAVLMVISIAALSATNEIKQKHDVKLAGLIASIKTNKSFLAMFASRGSVLELHGTLWPLYIFLVLGSILDLGVVIAFSTLISAVLMIYIGNYVDRHGEARVISMASILIAFSWAMRLFAASVSMFLATDVLDGFGLRMYQVSLDESAYKRAKTTNTAEALLLREAGLIMGALSILVISAVAIALTGTIASSFVVGFLFALIPIFVLISKK